MLCALTVFCRSGQDLVAKRVGYLACCTFLHPSHELLILVINSVQKDLRKDNILEVRAESVLFPPPQRLRAAPS
jgi:hypothetical protein